MNERIKQLAIASQLVYNDGDQLLTGWMDHVDLTEYLEEYAKLIVLECCSVIEKEGLNLVPGFLVRLTVHTEIDLIKKHFGIKND